VRIQAVTLDIGGTLIEPWPSVGHVYAEVAAAHGLKTFSAEQLNARFKTAWRARNQFGYSRSDWQSLVEEVFGGADLLTPGLFGDLYNRFTHPEVWRIYDDVLPALNALASREIKLAVISNWDERLRGLLSALKLDRYFATCAISIEVGFTKPSPVIFQQAAGKLGLPANSILHVGDSPEMDFAGATAAGFQARLIQRRPINTQNATLPSLGGLIAIIEQSHRED